MAQTLHVIFPAMRVIPSVEIEADAVLQRYCLSQQYIIHQRGRGMLLFKWNRFTMVFPW